MRSRATNVRVSTWAASTAVSSSSSSAKRGTLFSISGLQVIGSLLFLRGDLIRFRLVRPLPRCPGQLWNLNSHLRRGHNTYRFMAKTFKRCDHVEWNSEAGRVRGVILKKVVSDIPLKGYVHHASEDEPQYLIQSDKTDHVAIHKPQTLRHVKARTQIRRRMVKRRKLKR